MQFMVQRATGPGVEQMCSLPVVGLKKQAELAGGLAEEAAYDAHEVGLVSEAIAVGKVAHVLGALLDVGKHGSRPQPVAVRGHRHARSGAEHSAQVVTRPASDNGEIIQATAEPIGREVFGHAVDEPAVRLAGAETQHAIVASSFSLRRGQDFDEAI
jgi:hypothetical protein